MSEQSRFTDRDKAEKSDQLYETTEYSRRCMCDDIVELTFDNIKLSATIKKSEEDFANLQNKLMCSLLLMLGGDDDVDMIIEKVDELTRAFKDERVSTLQRENAKLREESSKYRDLYVHAIVDAEAWHLQWSAEHQENAKLRELCADLYGCGDSCTHCKHWNQGDGFYKGYHCEYASKEAE